jgi:NUC173 domain
MKTAALASQPEHPKLAFFQSSVLGLARVCDKLATTTKKNHNFYQARVVDLWSLLPCFCKAPTDIDDVLPSLATTFGKALEDKRYPQLVVCIHWKKYFLLRLTSPLPLRYFFLLLADYLS